jgi:DNA-binding winged helix-turn-helix (wHTH) protein
VSKDELCDAVWSPRIISNETLTSTIKDIREALDDQLQPRRYVRTLFGFGYRFVAPLESPSQERPEPVAGSGRHAQPLEHA